MAFKHVMGKTLASATHLIKLIDSKYLLYMQDKNYIYIYYIYKK